MSATRKAAPFAAGQRIRIVGGKLAGLFGTVTDPNDDTGELTGMVRINLPSATPNHWWVYPDCLEAVQ